jgi:hypothetical protein
MKRWTYPPCTVTARSERLQAARPSSSVKRILTCECPSKRRRTASTSIARLALEVVEREGPVHSDVLVRRVAAAWSLARVTGRVQERVLEVLDALPARQGTVVQETTARAL